MNKPADRNPHSTIFLYGPPGSGKSTVGRLLAASLERPFYDLDETIEAQTGMRIPEIFASAGENSFRTQERAALDAVLTKLPGVIALGGGALLNPESRRRVEATGRVICLQAPVEILHARLQSTFIQRPLLKEDGDSVHSKKQLQNILVRRAAHYASFPLQLETAIQSPEQGVWEAQVLLGLFQVHGMIQEYEVRVSSDGLSDIGEVMHAHNLRGPVVVVSDDTVAALYASPVMAALQTAGLSPQLVRVLPGERFKTMETVASLWDGFLSASVERSSTVIALGGGVVGDLAGFSAATFLRGVRWVVLPTTLLAMVDASLGGKTGANLTQGKNLVGAFHPPSLVLADPATLSTLPEPELRNGLAEVVKHGVIGDASLFELCTQGWQAIQTDWDEVVRRGMAVKIKIIQEDPYEGGRREALNLGHTIGHAIELASGFHLRHGEAVAIGMVSEARMAERMGIADKDFTKTIIATLQKLGLPTEIPAGLDWETVQQAIRVDKKLSKGKVRFSLPIRVGEVKIGVAIDNLEEELCTLF